MKKIYLQEVRQFDTVCYIGKIDPRELVKVATKIEIGEVQDAQRPLSSKRIKDIAKYVAIEKGMLPTTLIIASNDNSFSVKKESNGLLYIEFPETEDEFIKYENKVDVMDGQHRLYSFLEDIRLIDTDAKYEIGFTLYVKPTMFERRKIFVVCNEKQEKVSGNLLMWFRNKLQMLSENEKNFYSLVDLLNQNYPLQGRVVMGSEKIKNGIKAKELMKILEKAKINNLQNPSNSEPLTNEQLVKMISTYLSGWEKAVGFNFSEPTKSMGAGPKIAGVRFMIFTLHAFIDRAIFTKNKLNEDFVIDTVGSLATDLGIKREEFFTADEQKKAFRERSLTENYAEQCSSRIKILEEKFNPFE